MRYLGPERDLDELERLVLDAQGKSLKPSLLRSMILGSLLIGGVVFIVIAWRLEPAQQFTSGILSNLGCELIGSMVIFLVVEKLAQSLQEQSRKDRAVIEKLREIRNKPTERPPIVSDVDKFR